MKDRTPHVLPALRFDALTPLYDTIVRYTTRERRFKSLLIDTLALERGEAVLDIGCGTGTLLAQIARRVPDTRLSGLDADPAILEIARRKLAAAGVRCELIVGHSTNMELPAAAFDHVVSTLFFHHLPSDDKRKTVNEIWRVLKPGGSVSVADWGRPTGVIQRLAFYQVQLFDGFATTRGHVSGELAALFETSAFVNVEEFGHLRTVFGTLRLLRGFKKRL